MRSNPDSLLFNSPLETGKVMQPGTAPLSHYHMFLFVFQRGLPATTCTPIIPSSPSPHHKCHLHLSWTQEFVFMTPILKYIYNACFCHKKSFLIHNPIYTDRSKIDSHVSTAAAISHQHHILYSYSRPEFQKKCCALFPALKYWNSKRAELHIDLKSCLPALKSLKTDHPIVDILIQVNQLQRHSYTIVFCWTLGHGGIFGKIDMVEKKKKPTSK